jgi:hypothetical protein
MITEQDIYNIFRKVQSQYFERPYVLPKDWNSHFEKMPEKQKECLVLSAKYFNTKWDKIDIERFMVTGFELFRNGFSYRKFFDPKILKHYINRDKLYKLEAKNIREDITNSIHYVNNTYNRGIIEYSVLRVNNISQAVDDYVNNRVGKYFLTYLLMKKYIVFNDVENMLCPLIADNYREYVNQIENVLKNGLQK